MKHYTKETFNPTESVYFAIDRVRNRLLSQIDTALRGLGVTSRQMGILHLLGRGVADTPFELARRLDMDTSAMTRVLDRLETGGLLIRSRNTDDRRIVNLVLTKKGEEVVARIPEIAPAILSAQVKEFTESELNELRRLLGKFLVA
ncbi:MarR family winged helix-turn-helix transcriptional regulator [Paraburkholderia ultramafica]|uniref:MarR family winged helix-turn-helix transcriptional regulator n=1 Tax=Paraburkholderia ultramafica TaxID=1544867 RepID=UPI0015818926|nr:MarR family transcriptional regulator [Paraburkholderia ultramafica]